MQIALMGALSYDNRCTARIEPEAERLIGDLERESGAKGKRVESEEGRKP